jgi:hypothetical protein
MDESIKKYIAQKAIADFKNDSIEPTLLKILSKGEYSKYFREYITTEDKELLYGKLFDSDPNVRIFTGIIIRPIINLYRIDDLFNYWNKCINPVEKDYFVYDLADYKNLTEEHHRKLFNYVKNNLEYFTKSKRDYLKADLALVDLKKKIKGTVIHPITKKWIYWVNILSYLDVITGKELVTFLNEIDTSKVNSVSEVFYLEVKDFIFNKILLTNKNKSL